jgi:nitrite reductase/ring-hydroxylating ferredoxin subunit
VGAAIEHTVGDLVAADPDPTLKPGPLVPQAGAWQPVVASDALPDGGVTAFDLGEVTGFVRRSAGRISAVSGICTHQGCRLRLDAGEQLLRCPCHDTTFALDGELRSHALPAPPRPLPHLEVRETDGEVEVFAPTQDDESPSGPPPSTAARA